MGQVPAHAYIPSLLKWNVWSGFSAPLSADTYTFVSVYHRDGARVRCHTMHQRHSRPTQRSTTTGRWTCGRLEWFCPLCSRTPSLGDVLRPATLCLLRTVQATRARWTAGMRYRRIGSCCGIWYVGLLCVAYVFLSLLFTWFGIRGLFLRLRRSGAECFVLCPFPPTFYRSVTYIVLMHASAKASNEPSNLCHLHAALH